MSNAAGRITRVMFLSLNKRMSSVQLPNRRWLILVISLMALILVMGCYNPKTGAANIGGAINFTLPAFPETGSNRVQVFTEMHYQPSFRTQDVPRLLPPDGSVPVTGAEVVYTSMDEYEILVRTSSDVVAGQRLYQVNCQVCHGQNLDGKGPIVPYMTRGALPANLHDPVTKNSTDGELYGFISCGGRQGCALLLAGRESQSPMPEFRRLLSEEERWALVAYLRGQIGSQ